MGNNLCPFVDGGLIDPKLEREHADRCILKICDVNRARSSEYQLRNPWPSDRGDVAGNKLRFKRGPFAYAVRQFISIRSPAFRGVSAAPRSSKILARATFHGRISMTRADTIVAFPVDAHI